MKKKTLNRWIVFLVWCMWFIYISMGVFSVVFFSEIAIIIIAGLIIHEVGHWVMFRYYQPREYPPIRLTWWGIAMGGENYIKQFSPRQLYTIGLAGPAAGYFVIILANDVTVVLAYFLVCFIDFHIMLGCLEIPKHLRNYPLKNFRQCVETKYRREWF